VGLLSPEYDVVERVVIYRLNQTLEPGTLYTVELLTPNSESGFGFQAFDGAPLTERSAPLKFNFFTRRSTEASQSIALEEIPGCERILELFQQAGCAGASCHGGESPNMGLRLDSAAAFAQTAIGRVAHQTELGPSTGVPLRNPERFGVQMPVVDPGQPGNSYLLYKLIRGEQSHWQSREDPRLCESRYPVELGATCLQPPVSELVRLREWFVRGDPMPPDGSTLLRSQLREIQRFIAGGASCH
jgi:hypothetical protein